MRMRKEIVLLNVKFMKRKIAKISKKIEKIINGGAIHDLSIEGGKKC